MRRKAHRCGLQLRVRDEPAFTFSDSEGEENIHGSGCADAFVSRSGTDRVMTSSGRSAIVVDASTPMELTEREETAMCCTTVCSLSRKSTTARTAPSTPKGGDSPPPPPRSSATSAPDPVRTCAQAYSCSLRTQTRGQRYRGSMACAAHILPSHHLCNL